MMQFIAREENIQRLFRDKLTASVALVHVMRKPILSYWAPAITKYTTMFKALTVNLLAILT